MWLWIFSGRKFEETFENAQWRKIIQMQPMWLCNLHLLRQAIWGYIWKCTVEKSHSNATNAIRHCLKQAIWGDIWKRTVEKSQTNATNVTLHPLRQAIWGDIWKHTVEKSPTNATNVTLHPLAQKIWRHIWKHTLEKSPTNATNEITQPSWTQFQAGNLRRPKVPKHPLKLTCGSAKIGLMQIYTN